MRYTLVLVSLIGLLGFCTSLNGQQRFNGNFTVGAYTGTAQYGFKVTGNDTVLDGSFLMQRSSVEALLKDQDTTFSFTGRFEEGVPIGFWKFQFGEFQSENKSRVIDYQYRVPISGIQEEGSGALNAGRPDGPWEYMVQRIADSEIAEVYFKSHFDFDQGVPQRSFSIESEYRSLLGRFLRNGLAHDEWEIFTDEALEATERWFFKEGVLQRIRVDRDGRERTMTIYGNRGYGNLKTVNLDARYLKAVQLQAATTDSMLFVKNGVLELLDKNAAYYRKMGEVLSELGKADFNPEFKVKLPYYPLDSVEIAYLQEIRNLHSEGVQKSTSFLDDSQLNILKLSDPEANFLYEVVQAVSDDFLSPIGRLLTARDDGILEFVGREHLRRLIWSQGIPDTSIAVAVVRDSVAQTRSFEVSNARDYEFNGALLEATLKLSRFAMANLDSVAQVLDAKLITERRQQELVALEEKLVTQEKLFDTLKDSLGVDAPGEYVKALEGLKSVADTKLSAYAKITNADKKLIHARELTDCFEQLLAVGGELARLPKRSEEISDHYLDGVWNPFTATVMQEEMKKRLTTAYRKVLVPYFLESVQRDIPCSEAEVLQQEMIMTHESMLQLRDADTAKLERKVRREQNPKAMLELINKWPRGKAD